MRNHCDFWHKTVKEFLKFNDIKVFPTSSTYVRKISQCSHLENKKLELGYNFSQS